MQSRKSEEERMDNAITALVKAARRFRKTHSKWKNPLSAHDMHGERELVEAVLRYTDETNS